MSGHSKWSTIKRKKGVADARRGALFTKLGKVITVAARSGGGDPDANFSLRMAMDQAKAANLPKENIERAIRRGIGGSSSDTLEEVMYEGYGPGGAALLIKALTDNRNRTSADIKHLLSKYGGSLGKPGTVTWQFQEKGVIHVLPPFQGGDREGLELKAIDLGAEDVQEENGNLVIYTDRTKLQTVQEGLAQVKANIEHTAITQIPDNKTGIDDKAKAQLSKLFDELDENDDVDNYWHNAKLS